MSKAVHITTATTTTVRSGRGIFTRLVVNTTAAGTITIYDSLTAAGTVLAVLKASVAEQSFEYGISLLTGLTVVTAGASDLTVVID